MGDGSTGRGRQFERPLVCRCAGFLVNVLYNLNVLLEADHCTPNCLPLRTFAKPAADRMKTASATAVVSATSCTCVSHPRNSSLRYGMASALSVGSTHPKFKAEEAVGSHLSARVDEGEVPVRDAGVATGRTGGRASRLMRISNVLCCFRVCQTTVKHLSISCDFLFCNQ